MNNLKDKSIELLQLQLTKLKNIQKIEDGYSRTEVIEWIASTVLILEGIFGRDSLKLKEIEKIRNTKRLYSPGLHLNYYKASAITMGESILQSCIDQIENLGIPSDGKGDEKNKLNLTIIQQQSNSQNINIEIVFQLLHDELSGKQLKDIHTILGLDLPKEVKDLKLVEKFKEFGVDILSGIISGIITNLIK